MIGLEIGAYSRLFGMEFLVMEDLVVLQVYKHASYSRCNQEQTQ